MKTEDSKSIAYAIDSLPEEERKLIKLEVIVCSSGLTIKAESKWLAAELFSLMRNKEETDQIIKIMENAVAGIAAMQLRAGGTIMEASNLARRGDQQKC